MSDLKRSETVNRRRGVNETRSLDSTVFQRALTHLRCILHTRAKKTASVQGKTSDGDDTESQTSRKLS